MAFERFGSDPEVHALVHALSPQALEDALDLCQHSLEHYQQRVAMFMQGRAYLQQEQARRKAQKAGQKGRAMVSFSKGDQVKVIAVDDDNEADIGQIGVIRQMANAFLTADGRLHPTVVAVVFPTGQEKTFPLDQLERVTDPSAGVHPTSAGESEQGAPAMAFEMPQQFADPAQREALSDAQLDDKLATWQRMQAHLLACLVSATTDLNALQHEYAHRQKEAPTHNTVSLVHPSQEVPMIIERFWSDPEAHALSQQGLEGSLKHWQWTLERCLVSIAGTALDVACLQQEQARRQALKAGVQEAPADTVPPSDCSL